MFFRGVLKLSILLLPLGAAPAADQTAMPPTNSFANYKLSYVSATDPGLQLKLEAIDSDLRSQYGMTTNQTAVGILDLKRLRLAMLHPDREEYAASVAKIGILLAWFQTHPEA